MVMLRQRKGGCRLYWFFFYSGLSRVLLLLLPKKELVTILSRSRPKRRLQGAKKERKKHKFVLDRCQNSKSSRRVNKREREKRIQKFYCKAPDVRKKKKKRRKPGILNR